MSYCSTAPSLSFIPQRFASCGERHDYRAYVRIVTHADIAQASIMKTKTCAPQKPLGNVVGRSALVLIVYFLYPSPFLDVKVPRYEGVFKGGLHEQCWKNWPCATQSTPSAEREYFRKTLSLKSTTLDGLKTSKRQRPQACTVRTSKENRVEIKGVGSILLLIININIIFIVLVTSRRLQRWLQLLSRCTTDHSKDAADDKLVVISAPE